jgi:hypothetical protein
MVSKNRTKNHKPGDRTDTATELITAIKYIQLFR